MLLWFGSLLFNIGDDWRVSELKKNNNIFTGKARCSDRTVKSRSAYGSCKKRCQGGEWAL